MSLGIIGGLGPMATAYFMELLINMTDAKCDQDHLEMIIYNCPSIPDRTAYILGKSNANPVVPIIKIGKKLKEQNVDCISIPCITAHYFHDEIEEKTMSDDYMKALLTQTIIAGNELLDYVPAYSNPAIHFATDDMGSDDRS